MKPVIGVTALFDDEKDSIWMLPGYMDGIRLAGGLPVILPLTCEDSDCDRLIHMCDGLLFTGGHDVDPAIYHEAPLSSCGAISSVRDAMELKLLEKAMSLDLPVFGICRGLQFFNAALGGTLYQDLPSQFPDAAEHHQQKPYDKPSHTVRILPGTPLEKLMGVEKLQVNSCHHQGVKVLAPGLLPMAIAEDGLVEALYAPHKSFLHAVQWHPEFMLQEDEPSMRLFRAFVSACTSGR